MPDWFFELNLIFELIFIVFTAYIAYYAFKIYKLSNQKESRDFGFGFSFLSLSYILLISMNSLFLSFLSGNLRVMELDDIMGLRNLMIASYLLFLILGFITIFYTTLKSKSPRIYSMLAILCLAAVYFSCNRALIVYILSSLLLLFISYNYIEEYRKNKNKNTLLVGLGMIFLLVSNVLMGFVGNYALSGFYVLSRIFEIAAYSLIMLSLITILKNGKKKK